MSRIVRARAPLRIAFGGGGTDLSPYVDRYGGLVLNATVDKYAYATLRFPAERRISVQSLDYQILADYGLDEPLIYDGKLDLIKGCLGRLMDDPDNLPSGLSLYLETDVPPGSGMGASSALVVAVIAALTRWRNLSLTKYELARLAWEIERKDVGVPGGLQDQYAAAFGGFNLIEFLDTERVVVNPLRIDDRIAWELEYNSLLVYTGATRASTHIIESQQTGIAEQRGGVLDALNRMKELTVLAKDALLRGELETLAELLHEEFLEKRRTSPAVSTPLIEEMYSAARRLGALGGKVSGAGGGGYIYLYCPFDRKPAVVERLTAMGARVSPVAFTTEGAQAWLW